MMSTIFSILFGYIVGNINSYLTPFFHFINNSIPIDSLYYFFCPDDELNLYEIDYIENKINYIDYIDNKIDYNNKIERIDNKYKEKEEESKKFKWNFFWVCEKKQYENIKNQIFSFLIGIYPVISGLLIGYLLNKILKFENNLNTIIENQILLIKKLEEELINKNQIINDQNQLIYNLINDEHAIL